jgi:hypothetical protein
MEIPCTATRSDRKKRADRSSWGGWVGELHRRAGKQSKIAMATIRRRVPGLADQISATGSQKQALIRHDRTTTTGLFRKGMYASIHTGSHIALTEGEDQTE